MERNKITLHPKRKTTKRKEEEPHSSHKLFQNRRPVPDFLPMTDSSVSSIFCPTSPLLAKGTHLDPLLGDVCEPLVTGTRASPRGLAEYPPLLQVVFVCADAAAIVGPGLFGGRTDADTDTTGPERSSLQSKKQPITPTRQPALPTSTSHPTIAASGEGGAHSPSRHQ